MQDHPRVTVRPAALSDRADAATVTFRRPDGHWWLWRPCPACGGVELPVRGPAAPVGPHCPECETRRRRARAAGHDPSVWYDTWTGGWVVQLPCGAPPVGVLLPLEIRWYDAGWAQVYRAAADLVYAGEPD